MCSKYFVLNKMKNYSSGIDMLSETLFDFIRRQNNAQNNANIISK